MQLVGSSTGLVHFVSSFFALFFGTLVLYLQKGTRRHKQVGYAYVASMAILLISSFMIYRLFKGWGIFHYFSIISLLSLLAGMIPILTKKPVGKWQDWHFSFMYWSVMGLYAAFAAETLTRIPETPFFGMVGIATAGIMLIAKVFFSRKEKKWTEVFKQYKRQT